LALIDFVDTTLSTIVTLFLAWRGATLWALLSNNIVTLSVNLVLLYIWRPVWRPTVTWDRAGIRYFLWFGVRNVIADGLLRALDKVDDLWAGIYLGDTALGYYSRAYTFAIYPRKILASPVNLVTGGTYAELKGDRKRLSQAFFRINALLVWVGFLLSGGLALLAPEFIRIVLGEKWLPMLAAFQLMLIYTLFDPIKITIAALFTAVGEPGKVVQVRSIQLIVLVIGLIILGSAFDIIGVALAVDLMLVVGMILFLWRARAYVDFSLHKIFGGPTISLITALILSQIVIHLIPVTGDWLTAILKGIVFVTIYSGILLFIERKEARKICQFAFQRYTARRNKLKPDTD
jgi:O-antigen/teichoic acid export membrane protein